jgi:hypothetical protein
MFEWNKTNTFRTRTEDSETVLIIQRLRRKQCLVNDSMLTFLCIVAQWALNSVTGAFSLDVAHRLHQKDEWSFTVSRGKEA